MKTILFVRKNLTHLSAVILLFSVSVLYSCSGNIFSEQDDIDIGKELDQQIKASPQEYPMLNGKPEVVGYVNDIGRYILNHSKSIKYKNVFPYTFQVVKDDKTINAFATPGGFVYVYTGLIKFLDNESTLAGVMAHEIAHAERRHATQRLTSYYGVSTVLGLVLGQNPNQLAEIAANLFVGLAFLKNSRDDELEADNYSMTYLAGSKYYPGSIKFFFDKIREEQRRKGDSPGDLERLLSTHPLPQDRIDNVEQRMKKISPRPDPTQGLNSERYQQIKSLLN